jgi:2-polyprenyl-3-methyl-5-hydroxy-6-metoxy-1,4-benzoquinol methylase
MVHKACILCDSADISPLPEYEEHQLVICNDCSFVFMLRIPTVEELITHYKTYSYTGTPNQSTIKSYNLLLDYFEQYRKNNSILDVGCGRGWFLDEAKKRGWRVYGTEFSSDAVKLCESKGIEMKQGDLDVGDFDNEKFDVVFSSEVIEHVNNPSVQFSKIYSVLRHGGMTYLTTPNWNCYLRRKYKARYNIIEYPEHLGYFTKKTINKGLTDVGFRKEKLLTTGITFSRVAADKAGSVSRTDLKARDEMLRTAASGNLFFSLAKKVVNVLLTISGLGFTLKAYYVKP